MRRRIVTALILSMAIGICSAAGVAAEEIADLYSSDAVLTDVENEEVVLEDVSEGEIIDIQEKGTGDLDDLIADPDAEEKADVTLESRETGNVDINEENFPDESFRNYVKINIAGGNNYLTPDDIEETIYIDVSELEITSLAGIQYFTELESLYCCDNKIESLDVSQNTALKWLYCYNNKLTSLDVSGCTNLECMDCSNNSLTSLDVSSYTNLTDLDCSSNELTSLDVSGDTALSLLSCWDNKLTSLDVSQNTALRWLYCDNNKLTSLDVSGCTNLECMVCSNNSLTSLDVSENTELENLSCTRNQIGSLDVSSNKALIGLDCSGNNLTSLDVSGATELEELYCYDNQIESLDVSQNKALTLLVCGSNRIAGLDVSNNTALKDLICDDNQFKALDVCNNTAITFLQCFGQVFTQINEPVELNGQNQFNFNTLFEMNADRVVNVDGGKLSDGILTFTGSKAIITYDCGDGNTLKFTLQASNYHPESEPQPQPQPQPTPTPSDINPVPADQTVSSVTAKVKKGTITVSWTNPDTSKPVSKIEVQYATKKNFKKNLKTKKLAAGKTKVTLKLKRKTNYFIRVRYKYTDGTTSKWTSVKKVKTK